MRALTNTSGTVPATYTYDPYGNMVASTGPVTTSLLYGGQYQDAESGLYYLRARYYDPTTAQFLTLDPAVATTLSPYGYVAGNPLNATDPTGMTIDPSQPNCDNPQDCQIGVQLYRLDMLRVGLLQQVQQDQRQFAENDLVFNRATAAGCATSGEGQMLLSSASQLQQDTNLLDETVQAENDLGDWPAEVGYGSTTNHNALVPVLGGAAGVGVCLGGLKGAVAAAEAKGTILWACFCPWPRKSPHFWP